VCVGGGQEKSCRYHRHTREDDFLKKRPAKRSDGYQRVKTLAPADAKEKKEVLHSEGEENKKKTILQKKKIIKSGCVLGCANAIECCVHQAGGLFKSFKMSRV
jgi:hypothetical protein